METKKIPLREIGELTPAEQEKLIKENEVPIEEAVVSVKQLLNENTNKAMGLPR